ncbi:hypothetical protein MHYP_G00221790 [Metynnis hypsauchen]
MLQRSTTLPLVSLHRKSRPVWTQVCGETSSLADEGQEWSLAAVQPQTAAPSRLPCIEARLRMTRSWPRGADVNWVMAEKIRFSIWAVPLSARMGFCAQLTALFQPVCCSVAGHPPPARLCAGRLSAAHGKAPSPPPPPPVLHSAALFSRVLHSIALHAGAKQSRELETLFPLHFPLSD